MNIKQQTYGIIFDLDGTLLDSVSLAKDIPTELMGFYNIPKPTEELQKQAENKLMKMISGKSSKLLIVKAMLTMAKFYGLKPFYKRIDFLKRAGRLYKERISKVPLINGAIETINKFQNELGYKVGINTTSSRDEILDRFEGRMEFLDLFGGIDGDIVSRSDIKHMKPNPESIMIFSEKWNINPNNLIMVGDMSVDILAGKNAGTKTIGVLTGFATRKHMEDLKPDIITQSVVDIPELINDIFEKHPK